MKKITLLLITLFCTSFAFAQITVEGVIADKNGMPVSGASVIEDGTTNGVISDFNGNYSITVSENATLTISYVGFETSFIEVKGQTKLDVSLSEGVSLSEVLVVGSRAVARSRTDTPLPIDVLSPEELTSTGQMTFDKALQYRIPSFNTVQTPVNDATSLLDPYEIRNMGPSRTLILINGKRKNLSALLYTQTSPGRGETGADISAIPTDAIKRVEILRDGASAQYGSDAIAGVMNIILKDNTGGGSATLRTGISLEGDGETVGISVNNGASINEDKGFANYTIDLSKVNQSNRPGTVNAAGETADFTGGTPEDLAFVNEFLSRRPDAGNINGSPETMAAKFLVNSGYDISDETELYFNAAYVYKKVNSFANYRTPYWRTVDAFPYLADFFPGDNPTTAGGYDGYVPTFEGDLSDYNGTVGFKSEKNGWFYDLSFTTGGNTQTYKVNDSHNRNEVFAPAYDPDTGTFEPIELYRAKSPVSFDPGGTRFSHNVGNVDISKALNDDVTVAVGAEFRTETFEVIEGGLASYDGGGADSFAGNRPENSGKWNRYNFGGYFDLLWDINDDFLVNGTVRSENYSDFGNAFVWKVSSRYKFLDDKLTLRASGSTGFRAPTLHQIYTQKAQYSFVPGQGIQVGGLVNNVSPQAKLLGLDQLDAEKSTNFTVGFGAKISRKFNFTIDYYNISVEDRIVLSTEVTPPAAPSSGENPFEGLSDLSFFANAIDTKTSGIDFVANYKDIGLLGGSLGFSLSGNYTLQNERDGAVKNPTFVTENSQSIINETQEALFFTSRPETKWILGTNFDIGKFGFSLNNTYFGKTEFVQQGLATTSSDVVINPGASNEFVINDLGTEFIPKIVTDLAINFNFNSEVTLAIYVNNLLNVLPEWEFVAKTDAGQAIIDDTSTNALGITPIQEQSNLITFNQRYSQMTYDGYHFSQLGTMFNFSLNYKF